MVAQLLRLRIVGIGNRLRFGLRPAFWTVVILLVALVASLVVAALASQLRFAPLGEVEALTTGAGSLLLVAFFVAPFAASRPAWSDPRRLFGYGVSTDRAAAGLALGGAIGLPALALVILATGYVRSWSEGTGIAWLAVVSSVLAGVTALLLALVASTLSAMSTTRRSRDLLVAGGIVLAILLVPLVVDLVRVLLPGGYPGSSFWTSALGWTPFGAALALPAHAATGDTGRVIGGLVVALASIGLLWWAWRSLVERALHSTPAPAVSGERVGLGWFDFTLGTPTGAVAARSLTYWARDARYRWSLVILPFLPLLVVPLGIAGIDWSMLALVPVPLMCLLLGFLPHNDVSYDNTALWLHIATNTGGLPDRVGRIAPPLVIGIPLSVVGSLVAVWLHGDFGAFGAEFGVSFALLLSGLGLSSILSAALPYAAVRPGDDPFQQPQTTGSAPGWSQSIMFGGAVLLSAPTGWLAVMAAIDGRVGLTALALLTGLATGVVVLVAGILIGSRIFAHRAPELLAFALRS
ncbi:ABC transporter permease [Frondihabitans peucedani]|uniref:ABC-2 type transport system permease protein n=1 Tax=Frondihabitans peucedani TaxID=598626 RepID=A0ABP8E3V0_9MICO